jgi:hypothetical protein
MGATKQRRNGSRSAWFIAAALVMTGICGVALSTAHTQFGRISERPIPITAASGAQEKLASLIRIEDAEEALPPLVIQGKEFTVVIHKQRLVWPEEARHKFDADGDETARSFEVRDATGAAVYTQKIEDPASEAELAEIRQQGRFTFTEAVYASRMQGAKNQALVVGWSSLPSAPDSCSTYVVLGLFDGKLVPFSEPFCENILSMDPVSSDRTWRLKKDPEMNFEIFEIRRGYGFFRVIIPIRVDFVMAKLFPARWCVRLGAPAALAQNCEFAVEAERRASKEDTFVRLFASPEEERTPSHVVVRPDSGIEFIAALAPNAMDRNGQWKDEQSGEIPWLKVRIDGKEGWVHAAEDLNALGLYQAG